MVMETRSDNLKKVPLGSKTSKLSEATRIKRKVAGANLERHAASISRTKEIPQLTPLHRLQKFKVIRDRNLKSRGFKTSLENKIKKMEGNSTTTSNINTVEAKEKVMANKETVEEIVVGNTNGIEKLDKIITDKENGHVEESSSSPKEENHLTLRIKETSEDKPTEKDELKDEFELKSKPSETSNKTEPIQDSNIESNMETEETNKVHSASFSDNEAVSSVSSLQPNNNSTPGPTDDEEEVEVIESKPEYESNSKENKSNSVKVEKREDANDISFKSSKESAVSSNKALLNASTASSYKSSYSNPSRIYGRRPVRSFTGSRKRKLEEVAQNCDFKRTNSPSQPSPRWRFIPSAMNFWTPRTTPFVFSSTTPMKTLNDSMTVNIDEDTIRNDLDDSDLFSDADDFTHQPAKKFRWGCAIM